MVGNPEVIRKRASRRFTGDLLEADLNEAALRRTHSRIAEPTAEVI
jgi:hypothetical protein